MARGQANYPIETATVVRPALFRRRRSPYFTRPTYGRQRVQKVGPPCVRLPTALYPKCAFNDDR